jgi:hypothetical protein
MNSWTPEHWMVACPVAGATSLALLQNLHIELLLLGVRASSLLLFQTSSDIWFEDGNLSLLAGEHMMRFTDPGLLTHSVPHIPMQ